MGGDLFNMKLNNHGLSIVETLLGLGIVVIITLSTAVTFSDYWAISAQQKKANETNDLSVMILSDIMQSRYEQIVALCTAKAAWTQRTSSCNSLNLKATPPALSVTPQANLPNYSSLLGVNLAGYSAAGSLTPSCLDVIHCKRLISSDLLELVFLYQFLDSRSSGTTSQTIILRRGPW